MAVWMNPTDLTAGQTVIEPDMDSYRLAILEIQGRILPPTLIIAPAGASVSVAASGGSAGINALAIPNLPYDQLVTAMWSASATGVATATDVWQTIFRINGADTLYTRAMNNIAAAGTYSFVQPANTAAGTLQTVLNKVSGTGNVTVTANDSRFAWLRAVCLPILL